MKYYIQAKRRNINETWRFINTNEMRLTMSITNSTIFENREQAEFEVIKLKGTINYMEFRIA